MGDRISVTQANLAERVERGYRFTPITAETAKLVG